MGRPSSTICPRRERTSPDSVFNEAAWRSWDVACSARPVSVRLMNQLRKPKAQSAPTLATSCGRPMNRPLSDTRPCTRGSFYLRSFQGVMG
jgi:hypothetical protein